ncbi:MAG TPA: RNA polymerase sigma factor [Hyphomicrobiales bacterium]|nr:RNA polymerase sigma factor [Hyphomicrobiales bacterium]
MAYSNELLRALIEYESDLRRFLARRLGCVHTASDILQRVAEKLLAQPEAPPVHNLRPYLFRVVNNEMISHYRSERLRAGYEAECAELIGEEDNRSAERVVQARESLAALQQALSELPLLTRRIFQLYRLEGCTQKEIAARLKLHLSTVEKRLAFAMKYCRERLREQEIYGMDAPQASAGKKPNR